MFRQNPGKFQFVSILKKAKCEHCLELVSKELNHSVAILHVYAGTEFDFYEVKKNIIIFQKEKENTFTLFL